MATERTYTIPLRKYWIRVQKFKRAKRAINGIKQFLEQHMKSEDIKIGMSINLFVWKHSIQNPPSRVKVNVTKDDKGQVKAELFGFKAEEKPAEKKKGIVGKVTDMVTGKKDDKKESKPAAKTEIPQQKPLVVEKSPKKPMATDAQAMKDLAESAKKLTDLTKKAPKAK